ncbi:winged helix-turn-helix domain-containing protein, partial [Vibrio fortis]
HTVCSTVNRLRSKLVTQDGEQNYIQTVWGVGYKFHAKH